MKHIIRLFVLLELGFFIAALAYAVHGIFWLNGVSILRAVFLFLAANYLFPALIQALNKAQNHKL